MQFLSLLFLALPAAFAAPAMVSVDASALDISSVPTCALAPAMAAFQEAGCQPMDVKCACSATLALAGLVVKVRRECSEADFQKAFDFAKGMCLEVGIDVPMTKPY